MPRKPAKPRPSPQRKPLPYAGKLIPIDGEPIRKKAQKAYEKARRELDQARTQLDQFHTQHRPAFEQWLNSHFGPQLTMLRELGRQLNEQEQLITDVEEYEWIHQVSTAQAYAAVQRRRAGVTDPAPEPPPHGGPNPSTQFSEEGAAFADKSEEEAFNEFAKAFEGFFGQSLPPGFRPPPPTGKPAVTATVKELYRTLVRKLHPDKQAAMTAQKLEWWHEVQAAYTDGDAERLAAILSLVELAEGNPAAHTNVATFQLLAARLKANLRELKRELAGHRHHPGWRFKELTEPTALAQRIRRDFDAEACRLNIVLEENAERLRAWEAEARRHTERRARPGAKNRRRTPPGYNEFSF